MRWLEGSGSVYSTAPDLYRWLESIRSEIPLNLDSLPYPYGWGQRTRLGREMLEQTGRIPTGYASYVGLYPEEEVAIVVLSNIQAEVTERMGTALAAITFGEPYEVPTVRPHAVNPESGSWRQYEGSYEISPGFDLTVRAAAKGLLLAGPDGAFLPLDYESPDHFFFRPLYVPISFVRDSLGQVAWLNWNGQFKARRRAER